MEYHRVCQILKKIGNDGKRYIIGFIIGLAVSLLINSAVLPLFTGKTGFEIINDAITNNDLVLSVDDEIEPVYKPGIIYQSKDINYSKFWKILKNHAVWMLEFYNKNTEEWMDVTNNLNINRTNISYDTEKLSLQFNTNDAPYTSNYRLTLVVDYVVKQFINHSGENEYILSYNIDNHEINLVFNWSDIAVIPDINIHQGMKNIDGTDYFFFRVRKNDIPPDRNIVLDPKITIISGSYGPQTSNQNIVHLSNGSIYVALTVDNDIYICSSHDDGVTWNNQIIGETDDYDNGVYGCELIYDHNETLHVIWNGKHKGSTSYYQLRYTNSNDWNNVKNLSSFLYTCYDADICVNSNDKLYATTNTGASGATKYLYLINSSDNGATWSNPFHITNRIICDIDTDSDSYVDEPNIFCDSNDYVHCVFSYQNYGDPDIDYIGHIESKDNGLSWSGIAADIFNDPDGMITSCNAWIDNTNNMYVVGIGFDGDGDRQVMYSWNSSNGWIPMVQISDELDATGVYLQGVCVQSDYDVNIYTTNFATDRQIFNMSNVSDSGFSSYDLFMDPPAGDDYLFFRGPNQNIIINNVNYNLPKTGWHGIGCYKDSDNATYDYFYWASSDITWDSGGGITWNSIITGINGSFYNITFWNVIIDDINGSFYNVTAWETIITDVNGSFYNQSQWLDIIDDINGSFYNITFWNNVIDNINGSFYNTTIWQNIITGINGSFYNTTLWFNIISDINGTFYNQSQWLDIIDDINGTFYNSTQEQWHSIITGINGSFYNSTTWHMEITDINGSFYNTTIWNNIIDNINGSFYNTTLWLNIIPDINGTFYNASIYKTIITDINGTFYNTTIWQNIITGINGSFYNTTIETWQSIITDINGSFYNITFITYPIITDINGSFYNVSTLITISNVYPANHSKIMNYQPLIYFTLDHKNNQPMNYSIYIGNSSMNTTLLLVNVNGIYDGVQKNMNQVYYLANSTGVYYYRIHVNDNTSSINRTFYFNCITAGMIISGGNGAVLGIAAGALLFGVFSLMVFIRRKKRG